MQFYFTSEKIVELKRELDELKSIKRAEVAERLKRAKELGDLSENSEYFEAREEQGQVEGRILELENMLKNTSVIVRATGGDMVAIGSTIDVSKNGQKFKFTIVGSNEAEPEKGLLSNESPLGKSFMGKKAGDQVKVKTPSGEVIYSILKIE